VISLFGKILRITLVTEPVSRAAEDQQIVFVTREIDAPDNAGDGADPQPRRRLRNDRQ
jgi:hypothetical protein